MELSSEQYRELEHCARHGQPAYLRTKALVLVNLVDGRPVQEISKIFRVSRQSVYTWSKRYIGEGLDGLRVHRGRGRKARVDLNELEHYLRQSPRQYGIARTRWSLATLAKVVPSLKGFSPYGVQKALARAGFHYKRGQPLLHSPDPHYEVKKGLWTKR
jgi:transposase